MRNDVLDSIKGICLLHMLLLHICIIYGAITFDGHGAGLYFHVMSFFMVPFYVISGYFFSRKKNIYEFVKHKSKSLLLPWAFWSFISFPIYYLYDFIKDGDVDWLFPFGLLKSIMAFSSNDALWFLFSLFCVNFIYYILHSKFERHLNIIISCLFLISVVDCYKLPNVLSSSNIILGLVYFHIGQKIRNLKLDNLNGKSYWVYLVIALTLFCLICLFDRQYMMFVSTSQFEGNYLLNIIYSLLGTFLLYCICRKELCQKVFSWFGRNSLAFYVWHMIPLRYIIDPIARVCYPDISLLHYILISGGVILLSSLVIIKIANNKYSWILGK